MSQEKVAVHHRGAIEFTRKNRVCNPVVRTMCKQNESPAKIVLVIRKSRIQQADFHQ
jgi:hypothetical protein